jgi:hypothetical protein
MIALCVAAVWGCNKDSPVQPQTCNYTLSSTSQSASADGGSSSINVTLSSGSCGWTAQSDAAWITLSNNSGSGTAALGFAVGANTSTDSRTGRITVNWTGGSSQLTVTQTGATPPGPTVCTYTIDPVAVTAPAGGVSGQSTVTVTGSDCSWSARSNQGWIRITSGNSGTGTGTISYTVDAHTGAERFGRIIVTHTAGTTDIGFTQNAPCPVSLNPTSNAVGSAGGSFSAAFTTSIGCAWSAASNASWLTIASATSGTGDATISYSVAANSGTARTGQITVTASGSTVQLTVTQSGTGTLTASFTVSPTPCPVTATGSGTNLLSCTFDGSGSTGTGINSYVFRLGSVTGPILGNTSSVVNPTVACGAPLAGSGTVAADVFLTITSPAGSSTTSNSVTFSRSSGC